MARVATKAEFQKASNLTLVRSAGQGGRGGDVRLQRIDSLLEEYEKIGDKASQHAIATLTALYYAAEIWLKAVDRKDTSTHAGRKPAVDALYATVVQELSTRTQVPINLLPGWIAATFGKANNAHGIEVDLQNDSALYMDKAQRETFRLIFKGGLAYQQAWWIGSKDLVLANSTKVQPELAAGVEGEISRGYSGYVLSLAGDFYTNQHKGGAMRSKLGQFHSTYFSGEPILCAGEIQIVEGVVKAINTSSGHYQPSLHSMKMALQVLNCLGAYRPDINVKVFGKDAEAASQFMTAHGGAVPEAARDFNHHMTGRQVKQTRPDPEKEQEWVKVAALFKKHWAPTNQQGHGVFGRQKCAECRAYERFWNEVDQILKNVGGLSKWNYKVKTMNLGMEGFATRHLR